MSRQPSFEVFPSDLFDSFVPDASRVSGLKGQVLAKINDAGLLVGDWRVAANGREDVTVCFSGAQIYDAPEISGYNSLSRSLRGISASQTIESLLSGQTCTHLSRRGRSPSHTAATTA